MQISNTRYTGVLFLQYSLIIEDLLINSFSECLRYDSQLLLIFYIIQDLCIVFALTILLLSFFSTYLFQAGLVYLLYNKFCAVLYIIVLYLALTLTYHCWSLQMRWANPMTHIWSDGLHVVYSMQRLMAIFYYYFYKRAVLRISDPRFYKNEEWSSRHLTVT